MILSAREKQLVAYALRFLASNLDQDNLEDLGLADQGITPDNQDHQAEQLSANLLSLAERFVRL